MLGYKINQGMYMLTNEYVVLTRYTVVSFEYNVKWYVNTGFFRHIMDLWYEIWPNIGYVKD